MSSNIHRKQSSEPLARRRQLLQLLGLSAAELSLFTQASLAQPVDTNEALKGNIHHSVCRWTFSHLSMVELCETVARIGFSAIDLVEPQDWPILKAAGIDVSMCSGAEIDLDKGWNNPIYHNRLLHNYRQHIELMREAGYQNLICFTGNRGAINDAQGLKHCVKGLKKLLPHAEKHGITLHLEILNSRIDHPDYMGDHSDFVFEVCRQIDSAHLKALFDIYHVQISEGDIIRRIKKNAQYIGHYHTGGVPGRGEIGETQELNYRAIMQAIVATNYTGYVAQEFLPKGSPAEKEASLQRAIRICDI